MYPYGGQKLAAQAVLQDLAPVFAFNYCSGNSAETRKRQAAGRTRRFCPPFAQSFSFNSLQETVGLASRKIMKLLSKKYLQQLNSL